MNKLIVKTGMMLLLFLIGACTSSEEDVTGNLTGRITDALTGEAIQGVNITLTPGGLSRTTGSDGTYDFMGIDALQYTVQAQKADYKANTKTVNVLVGKTATGDMSLTPIKKLELNATALNFGKTNNSLSFEIQNKGTNKFNWNISGLGTADWIEVNPGSGALEGGKSCTVQVNILREKLTANAELTLMVNADKESVALKVTVEVEKKTAKIEIDPSSLDFGTEESVLTFNIKNIGNAGDVKWNITGLDVDWITLTPMEGTLGQDKTQAVKVTLARALVKEHVKTAVLVNAGGESLPIEITADEKKVRSISAEPVQVEFGEEKEKISLTLTSYNGSTTYMLLKKEDNAEWLSLSKTSGTIPQYDAANPAMKETIELSVSRKDLQAGAYSCTLVVRSDLNDLEIPVTMKVKEEVKPEREFKVQPSSIAIGTAESASFTMFSNNGATAYQLLTKEDVAWLSFSKTTGTVADGSSETINLTVNRASLAEGDYSCTIIVRTDLGDKEIPVTMTVEPGKPAGEGTIISCHEDLEFTLTGCKMSGTTATIDYTVKNIGNNQLELKIYGNGYSGYGLIYDDRGNQYNFDYNYASLQLGSNSNAVSVSANLPAGIMLKGSIKIPMVDEQASMFKNITLKTTVNSTYSDLIFKNIKIENRTAASLPGKATEGTVQTCHDDLEFTLLTCKRNSANTVTVAYRLKNIGKKMLSLKLYGSGYSGYGLIYDDCGNQYQFDYNGASLQLGSHKNAIAVNANIPEEVVLNGSIIIPAVDASAKKLSNITLKAVVGSEYSDLIFKDIVIQ